MPQHYSKPPFESSIPTVKRIIIEPPRFDVQYPRRNFKISLPFCGMMKLKKKQALGNSIEGSQIRV